MRLTLPWISTSPSHGSVRIQVFDLFITFSIFCFSSGIVAKFLRPIGLDEVIFLPIYAATLFLLVKSRIVPGIILICPVLTLVLLIPLASTIWSIDTGQTIFRSNMVLWSSLFGVMIGWYFTTAELLRKLAPALFATVVLCFVVIFALPSYGLSTSNAWGGTWIGLYNHKNGLGAGASVAVLVFTYAYFVSRNRSVILLGLFLSLVLLAGSKSATSQITTIFGFMLGAALLLLQRQPKVALLLAGMMSLVVPALITAILVFDLGPYIIDKLGKNETLGSRYAIWQLVWPYIEDRWWFGYGFGAFWGAELPWVDLITARLNFTPFYSHNGLVELWLGGGIVLTICTLLTYAMAWAKSWVPLLRAPWRYEQGFAVVFFTTFLLRNITEGMVLAQNSIVWIIFVALVVRMARDVQMRIRAKAVQQHVPI